MIWVGGRPSPGSLQAVAGGYILLLVLFYLFSVGYGA